MQTVKTFIFGVDRKTPSNVNVTPLEDQINDFLEHHPGYSIASMSTINAAGYKEAFVVFNIREEREKRSFEQNQNRKAKNNG